MKQVQVRLIEYEIGAGASKTDCGAHAPVLVRIKE